MSGSSLKDLSSTQVKVSYSDLVSRLGETLISDYFKSIKEYWVDILLHPKKGVSFPTMQKFFYMYPEYKRKVIELYVEKMSSVEAIGVDEDTMASQGALFDSICYVYDSQKDVYSLVTMNFDLLYGLGVEYNMLKQVLSKNENGLIKAYRIDIAYDNTEDAFTFKVVNARDFDIDDAKPDYPVENKRFYLVPYMYVMILMKLLENRLNADKVLKVTQTLGGVRKIRLITQNEKVLSSMCDVPEAVIGLRSRYFPLNGFFYAPSVGSPSTSAMVTNINLFDVDSIVVVPEDRLESQYRLCSIHKPINPVVDLVAESLVVNKLMLLKSVDIGDFSAMIDSLPNRNKYLAYDVDEIDKIAISKYLHSLSPAQSSSVYKKLDISDELRRRSRYFSSGTPMSYDELQDLSSTLKKGVCKLVIQKSDCKLSSVLCSNSESVLTSIYGKDYVRYYESFSVKFNKFYSWVSTNKNIVPSRLLGILCLYGLPNTQNDVDYVLSTIANAGGSSDNVKYRLESYFADRMGISLKKSNSQSASNSKLRSDGVILVRTLTSYIDAEGKPVDYYRRIDISKVISGVVFFD